MITLSSADYFIRIPIGDEICLVVSCQYGTAADGEDWVGV